MGVKREFPIRNGEARLIHGLQSVTEGPGYGFRGAPLEIRNSGWLPEHDTIDSGTRSHANDDVTANDGRCTQLTVNSDGFPPQWTTSASFHISRSRHNGQFGGHIFWEIRNGKITRQCTDVTYNAITTDLWGNLDAVTHEWQMHGTGGDAKGQPTQTNSISHGSPWLLIRKIMVGAAFD